MGATSKHTRTAAKPPEDREPQRSPVVKDEHVESQANNPKTAPDRHAHSVEASNADGHVAQSEAEQPRQA